MVTIQLASKLKGAPFLLLALVACFSTARAQGQRTRIAVVDFGNSSLARNAADSFATSLRRDSALLLLDREEVRAAAKGAGYAGSLNLSRDEARDLGAALGCDFFILGDAQTIRRSPSNNQIYFDSYASIFLVSARTGRLVDWQRPTFKDASATVAERTLLSNLAAVGAQNSFVASVMRARDSESQERQLASVDEQTPVIEAAPDDEKQAAEEGLRLPRPYRRLVPPYPDTAALAEVEAVVDVLVELDSQGEVTHAEIARWAGFGLDDATLDTVHHLHFFPAMRNGVAVPIRVLLRYNFRKPPPRHPEG